MSDTNLLTMDWIPVLRTNGRPDRVGIREALTQAGSIRQIAASNPMDNVALLRLLLAVLQWCKPTLDDDEPQALNGADGIPAVWLAGKLGTENAPNPVFDLLGEVGPFLQDTSVAQTKATPSTNLLHEVPSGSNVAHFYHARDFQSGLCPACCSVAIVRWSAYASAGTAGAGQSMTAAPNGNTPAYCQPLSSTLLLTLQLSWPISSVDGDQPAWNGAHQNSPLGILKGFTWRSRRMLINESDQPGVCLLCGQPVDRLVRSIYFRPGWARPAGGWNEDPHLLRVNRARGTPIVPSGAGPNDPMENHASQWRLLREGVLQRQSGLYQTTVVASSQQLFKDALERFDAHFLDESRDLLALIESLRGVIRTTTAPQADKKAWKDPPRGHAVARALRHQHAKAYAIRSALAGFGPALERKLDEGFEHLLLTTDSTSAVTTSVECWLRSVRDHLCDTVRFAVDATVAGSPLRRREAAIAAVQALDEQFRRLTPP